MMPTIKKVFAILALGMFSIGVFTQSGEPNSATATAWEWQRTFGGAYADVGNSVQQTSDGGYIIAGYTGSFGAGSTDVWLIKTDASGNMTWSKTFGGASMDMGESVLQTADGGYIIVGYTSSFGVDGFDVYLIKTDLSGNITWSQTLGETSTSGATSDELGYSVQMTSDGGYIIAGTASSFDTGNLFDIYLVKTDASGNMTWSRTFGGTGGEEGHSVRQTADGGYIIAGSTDSFGAGDWDIYLLKTDASGNMTWSKTFGGTGTEEGYSVQQTSDGGYIIVGSLLVKTDASGNMTWSQPVSGRSVQQTPDGGYIIAGTTPHPHGVMSDVHLIKTDASGSITWSQVFGGADWDWGHSVQTTVDGGYIVAGFTMSFGSGGSDVWLIKVGPGAPIPSGDANSDGDISILDLTKVLRMILLLETETSGADANQDGKVDALDLTKIVRLILRLD